MHLEVSEVISNPFLETLRIITTEIPLIMVIGFLKVKYDCETSRTITAKGHEERKDR